MDGDHTVTEEEFTERCMQLHGPARSADLFALKLGTVAWLWIEEGARGKSEGVRLVWILGKKELEGNAASNHPQTLGHIDIASWQTDRSMDK